MSAIKLYEADTTNFENNGLGVLTIFENDVVLEERNGQFYLEVDVYDTDPLFLELEKDRVLKCDASKKFKNQRFRIANITKKRGGKRHLYCEHGSYSVQRLGIKPNVMLTNINAQKALDLWRANLIGGDVEIVYSDITTEASTSWDIAEVTNARLALGGVEGSVLDTWGGEYRFDNKRISLLAERGKRLGAVIAYGKNLIDIEQEESIQDTYTCIYPFAKQTVDEVEKIYTINGYIVASAYANNYYHKRVLTVDFSQKFEQDEVPEQAKLISLSENYIKSNQIGIPKVSLEVSFVDLSDTEDYKNLEWYEEIELCDTVTVYFEKLGINVNAKVIETQYIPSLERYKQITIGEPRYTLTDKLNSISNHASDLANQAQRTANIALTSANGKNANYYGTAKPLDPKIGDLWYKKNGEYTEMWQYTDTGWLLIVDDLNGIKLNDEMNKNAKKVQDAFEAAKDAKQSGEQVLSLVEQAEEDSATALKQANSAVMNAQTALDAYNDLESNIKGLQTTIYNPLTGHQSQITQLSNQITSIVYESDGMRSHISQLSSDINLRVEKNNVVNQINISTESILIAGNKIHITGATTIDNATIKTAYIADLAVSTVKIADAAITTAKIGSLAVGTANIANAAITDAKISSLSATKITTGTLNAANVSLINMNASNITTGYLSADRIAANSITANKLATNAIQVGFNSIGSVLQISSSALDFYSGGTLEGKITSNGMEFWYGTRKIGYMGETYKLGNTSVRGIQMGLEYTGDFISWGYKSTSSTSTHTAMLTLDPKGTFSGITGIQAELDFIVKSTKSIKTKYFRSVGYTAEAQLTFRPQTIDSVAGALFCNSVENGGIWIGDNGKVAVLWLGSYYYLR